MIYANNLIERNKIILRNLNTNSLNTATDSWSGALTGYGFYTVSYETPLVPWHYYYLRFTYKFTTTNQSPTWCRFYIQGGMTGTDANINNPKASTEYTSSAIQQITLGVSHGITSGTLYNGNNNAISGVSSYVKNVLIYDVTGLYTALKAKGTVTSLSTLKTWCDSNLSHKPRYTDYDVSSLINDTNTKVVFDKGDIVANEFIEADGMGYYSVNTTIANNTYFDSTTLPVSVYNNSSGGAVTHTRVTDTTSPFYPTHPYVLKIVTNGTASPGAGGFYCGHTAAANKIFVEKFVAKIPTGYTVVAAANAQGTGGTYGVIGDATGNGDWKEYTILYKCGSSGTFSTGGHVYITGSNNTSVTWYVAYVNNCDITGKEYLKAYTVLPKKDSFSTAYMFSSSFNCSNLIPNGNCSKQDTAMLPSGWSYDTSDYPTSTSCNAKCSIVQPVNAAAGYFGGLIKINPFCKYKISYWVKCKADMTSFLTAIIYYDSEGHALNHNQVIYKSGTKTYLTAALNSGATTVTVANNANWADRSYGGLGFRSHQYTDYYNDKGSWNPKGSTGVISGITGSNTINLKTAYTGTSMPSGTFVVENYDGSTYPYPIGKGNLPTNNTWKYVEGYFGRADYPWDGSDNIGVWGAIPSGTTSLQLQLNIYSNNGTVPIKYCDIRIEPVEGSDTQRILNSIQLHK